MEKLKIGVLLSGSGTNLQAIIDEIANGLPVKIVHVLSSRPDAYGIERRARVGIPVTVFDRSCYEDREAADARIAAIMQEAGAEYLVMAGYMRKLTPVVLDAFPDHVLNLHPALLPSFKGAHAIQDAWDAGVKVTGVTVHLLTRTTTRAPSWPSEQCRCWRTTTSMLWRRASTRRSTSSTPKCCAPSPRAA